MVDFEVPQPGLVSSTDVVNTGQGRGVYTSGHCTTVPKNVLDLEDGRLVAQIWPLLLDLGYTLSNSAYWTKAQVGTWYT